MAEYRNLELTEESVFQNIKVVLSKWSPIPDNDILITSSLSEDLEIDVLELVTCIWDVEELLNINLPDGRVNDIKTVHDLVKMSLSALRTQTEPDCRFPTVRNFFIDELVGNNGLQMQDVMTMGSLAELQKLLADSIMNDEEEETSEDREKIAEAIAHCFITIQASMRIHDISVEAVQEAVDNTMSNY